MVVCGIDVGARTAKAVLLVDGEIAAHSIVRTGPESAAAAEAALERALETTALRREDIELTVATGYGRVVVPFAQRNVTEIACHARGNHHFFPGVRTILDMGGQDCKAIRIDESGKVTNFLMNDKCAAGTGRSMEIMASLLEIPLEEIGELSLHPVGEPRKLNTVCTIFAKSDALAMLQDGVPRSDILAGYCDAMATRVCGLLRRLGMQEDFGISGGIAKNVGVVRRIEEKLGAKAQICFEPQIVGALGAALFARDQLMKS